jgi:cell division inhibitor SulA
MPPFQPPIPPFQPPGQPQPPRKKRTGLIIGIVVLVIVAICGISFGAGLFGALGKANSDKAALTKAETHYGAAMKTVETATANLKAVSGASQADTKAAIADANKQLRTGRDEVVAAQVAIEAMSDSAGKTDYQKSLAAAKATLDSLQDMVAYMDTASGMADKAIQAGALTKAANKSLSDAVDSGNSRSYSQMRSQAVAASTGYTKAALLFTQAHALDPKAGLDKAAAYAQKRKLQADIVVRMADEGRANRVSAYNADIKKENALGKQAEAAGTPAIVSDPNWAQNRLADLGAKIEAAGKQADQLRSQALRELGVSQ